MSYLSTKRYQDYDDPVAREEFETEFDNATDESGLNAGEDEEAAAGNSYDKFVTPLANKLDSYYSEAQGQRQDQEDVWLADLMQWKGEYSATVKARIHPKRSKAYMRITRTKVAAVNARMSDILFPTNGDRHWGIKPTPVPDMSQEDKAQYALIYAEQTGQEPSIAELDSLLEKVAKERAEKMADEMADQLSTLKYRASLRRVIHSGNLYGTGILKGPLATIKRTKRWVDAGENRWVLDTKSVIKPYCEFVAIWDVFPDMSAKELNQCRYIIQRYVMNKSDVLALADRGDFDVDRIQTFLADHPNGYCSPMYYETTIQELSPGGNMPPLSSVNRYEVKEFWVQLDVDELRNEGVEIPKDITDGVVMANVWMLGPVIIKAVMSSIEGSLFPYHIYYFDKDETNIFGEGIASIMRDPQRLINAATRAMIDNAAITAGPIIEANTDLLAPGEDPTDIYPFRVFIREGNGSEAQASAIRVTNVTSHTPEFLSLVQYFQTLADEVTTIPRYMYGEASGISGAGRTASGLSMLMGSANITLKDQIKSFDDGITTSFIKDLYYWNMQFNPRADIKGDYDIVATGSTALMAKEVRAEHLNTFLQLTNNPTDQMFTNRDTVLREVAKVLDLEDLDLVKSRAEIQAAMQRQAEQAERDKQFMFQIAEKKAQSGGHMGNDDPLVQLAGQDAI